MFRVILDSGFSVHYHTQNGSSITFLVLGYVIELCFSHFYGPILPEARICKTNKFKQ